MKPDARIIELCERLTSAGHAPSKLSASEFHELADFIFSLDEDSGVARIAQERQRQQEVEGWTPGHDDQHRAGEMAYAAQGYALLAAAQSGACLQCEPSEMNKPPYWPWAEDWWKPSNDPIRNLEKSGALIAAEIDRLLRKKGGQS